MLLSPAFDSLSKTAILPRQARDKHREYSKNGPVLAGRCSGSRRLDVGQNANSARPGGYGNALFGRPLFMLKMIVLPRQARDEHREGRLLTKNTTHYRLSRCDAGVSDGTRLRGAVGGQGIRDVRYLLFPLLILI